MVELSAYRLGLRLDSPITISFHTWRFAENILVRLRSGDREGLGEAAPFRPITGDSAEELVAELRRLPRLELDPERDSAEALHQAVDRAVRCHTLRAAIDFAWHDLIGKIRGIPSWRLYADKRLPVPNTITLFINDSAAAVEQAAAAIFCRYPDLKVLKIKLKGDNDLPRVKAVRRAAPPGMAFTLDANQGFHDARAAVAALDGIVAELGAVLLVEEPCPKGDLEKMRYVTEHLRGTMVFADESAATVDDARAVIAARAAHGINIKLQKAGGIWPGTRIASLCRQSGLKTMVGSMLEGPLGNMAGVHFAVSTPGVMLTDLDMDLELPEHARGRAAFSDGVRLPNDHPGLGIEYDEAKIAALVRAGDMVCERIDLT